MVDCCSAMTTQAVPDRRGRLEAKVYTFLYRSWSVIRSECVVSSTFFTVHSFAWAARLYDQGRPALVKRNRFLCAHHRHNPQQKMDWICICRDWLKADIDEEGNSQELIMLSLVTLFCRVALFRLVCAIIGALQLFEISLSPFHSDTNFIWKAIIKDN